MNKSTLIRKSIAATAKRLAGEKRAELERMKEEHKQLDRPDFVWHYLLVSFATMGRASGWIGLIGDSSKYHEVRYEVLDRQTSAERAKRIEPAFRAAELRMPMRKTRYLLGCFDKVKELGGPEAAKHILLGKPGRKAKIEFLMSFPGIGDKYARNMMMDVYHEDFRYSIAIDARIRSLTAAWGLSFESYDEHEAFLLSVADEAGLNGWELDRLMFNYPTEFRMRPGQPKSRRGKVLPQLLSVSLSDRVLGGENNKAGVHRMDIIKVAERIKERFGESGSPAKVPLFKGGSFTATLIDSGIEVDNLGAQPFLPWPVFQEAVCVLIRNGGRAERGDAMNARLGDPKLPLDSVEGHVAQVVYGKRFGETVFRRITPIACILVWAGVCKRKPGWLVLTDE